MPETETVEAKIARCRENLEEKLDLSGMNLTRLPAAVGELTHLKALSLSNNKLKTLPSLIRHLTRLTDLNLERNSLTVLPDWISLLADLEVLRGSFNPIATLPEEIGGLGNLTTLSFLECGLRELPRSFGRLTRLSRLDLWSNKLSDLPESLGQLTALRFLDLGSNLLSEIPPWIGQFSSLEALYLWSNDIAELPASFGDLTSLEDLRLDNNRFTDVPPCLRSLKRLRQLHIPDNLISLLPDWLGELKRLRTLDLTGNRLTDLPESLRELRSLEGLYLHRNEALGLPLEVLGRNAFGLQNRDASAEPGDILDYYFRIRGGRRPLNEAKLILVGRGGVGKTSLVNRLVHDRFDPREGKTEGICITEWKTRLPSSEDVRLNVWDFGGQEIMHATHQFFLTQRSLYLLVLNGRGGGEDADAEYWLKLIDSFGGESPVIVVMNKIREHPFDLNRRALQQKYPVKAFVKTDCADDGGPGAGLGIAELREAIHRETHALEHLRDAFPASWFAIKDRLAGMDKNYLSFDQFREFCAANGEPDANAQEALVGYLHNLGIILNYRDDPRLQDTHVLNPHWVTNGIYKILNSEKLEQQQGEIELQDLNDILDAHEYPVGMRRFIFDLMKKFELCFSFPHSDTQYLVPELLDKQEPAATAEFRSRECLNFQYHYPVLPEGLLPRFIVRTHVLSEALPRWRTGVILHFDGNRALVKADIQDKRVTISVDGPSAGRRRLLAVIRADLERIHRDIKNLQPEQMVPLPDFPDISVPYQKLLVMERQGIREFPEVVGDRVQTVNVSELLNGVDLEGARERQKMLEQRGPTVRLFYSYSRKDETLRNQLDTHLKLLQRQGLLDAWSDRDIDAGEDWKQRISDSLEAADIVLLLVSADFLSSDYCFEIEMRRALERHAHGETRVVPVIVRDVNWSNAPFSHLAALPEAGLAVTRWPDRDSAWRNVSEGIQQIATELQSRGRRG